MTDYILQVDRLSKSFGAVQACKDLSFKVERGHIHALIGPNGAGKTTIINQLSGELKQDSGRILFNAADISRWKASRRAAAGMGRSFQITAIFEQMTVAENIALAIIAGDGHNYRFWRKAIHAPVVKAKMAEALARVDLSGKKDHQAAHLSHGEKRQLEVGMALVGEPELLMLDEPMAGQGAGGTVALLKLISGLKDKTTILLVEHDMDAVFALADRISVVVYGTCIATGTVEQIRANKAVQKAYLGEDYAQR
jgi:branched-chain amino acid transport system ATP-binding protein